MRRLLATLGCLAILFGVGLRVGFAPHAQEQFANSATTTLNGTIDNATTSVVVTSATRFPTAGNFRIMIGNEIMLVTAVSGSTFTVTRGAESTTAVSHTSGDTVSQIITAGSLRTLLPYTIVNGRLTTQTATCVSASDRTSQSTIYWTPCGQGSLIGLYDGTNWAIYTFSEFSLALSSLTSGKNYDVFVSAPAHVCCTLSLSSAWTSDSARNDALGTQDGIDVLSSDHTKRWVGMVRTTGTTTTEDSGAKRFFWNAYNQVARVITLNETTQHDYNTATWRYWNNSSANKTEFVIGRADGWVDMGEVVATSTSNGQGAAVGMGLNWTTGNPGNDFSTQHNNGYARRGMRVMAVPALGYNYIAYIEWGENATKTFFELYGRSILLN